MTMVKINRSAKQALDGDLETVRVMSQVLSFDDIRIAAKFAMESRVGKAHRLEPR